MGRKEAVRLRSKRRDGFEIIHDILQVCVNSSTKTQIVSAANLNNKRINRYLEFLILVKLLDRKSNGKNVVYRTTYYGEDILKARLRAHER